MRISYSLKKSGHSELMNTYKTNTNEQTKGPFRTGTHEIDLPDHKRYIKEMYDANADTVGGILSKKRDFAKCKIPFLKINLYFN